MPGTNAGTGQPIYFHCHKARLGYWRDLTRYRGHDVSPTGRTRPYKKYSGGARMTSTQFEYECSCGHIGWSAHIDLARRAGWKRDAMQWVPPKCTHCNKPIIKGMRLGSGRPSEWLHQPHLTIYCEGSNTLWAEPAS